MASYETAVALADYVPKNADEIPIRKGEKILVRAFNNQTHTAQGENEAGNVGWFPEEVIRVVQHVNAFDFLAMSLDGAKSPRVDNASLVDKKKATEEKLENFLSNKPPKKILLEKGILAQSNANEEFKLAQDALMKEKDGKKRQKLEKFFSERVDHKEKKKKSATDLTEKQVDALVVLALQIPLELHKHRLSFSGAELLKWLQDNKYAEKKEDATTIAQQLVYRMVIFDVSERTNSKFSVKEFYNLSCRNIEYSAMNFDKLWEDEEPGDILSLSVDILSNLIRYVDEKKFDFPSMRNDPNFVRIGLQLAALQKGSFDSLTYGSKEAFWLNIYNIMVLYMHCRLAPPSSRSDRQLLSEKCYFCIARSHFTISEVRDFVIMGTSQFPAKDKRAAVVVGEKDKKRRALFMFGLPDGTASAPGFYVFQPQNLENKLRESAMVFFESVEVDVNDLKVKCPRLVRSITKDCGLSDHDAIAFLADFLVPSKAKILKDQPGFELDVESTSSQDACYVLDSTVLNS